MKAVSEAISVLIIAATVIFVSLTIFYFATYTLSDSMAQTEYGYDKSIMINIADNFELFLRGNTYVANIPGRMVGLGYRTLPYHVYVNVTMPVQGDTVDYVELLIEERDPAGTSYGGPHYYVTLLNYHLVDSEVLAVNVGLNDTAGITDPAPIVVSHVYYANGTSVTLFTGIGNNVSPAKPLPIRLILHKGDRLELYLNDNYDDNNYGDGYIPLEITGQGLKTYDKCWEGGGWYHYTWFDVRNTNTTRLFQTEALYKPNNAGYPDYWYIVNEFSFKPDETLYYDIYYHQSNSVQYEITHVIRDVTQLGGLINRIINLDTSPKAIEISVEKAYASTFRILYGAKNGTGDSGSCMVMVTDIREIPCVYEYYLNGKTIADLDTLRIYKTVYLLGAGSESEHYLVRIVYVRIRPIVLSSSPKRISIVPSGNYISETLGNVTNLDIIFYNTASHAFSAKIGLDDIIPGRNPDIPVDVLLIVKSVTVVIG